MASLRIRTSLLLLLVALFHEACAFLPPVPTSTSSVRLYRSMTDVRSNPLVQKHQPAASTLVVPGESVKPSRVCLCRVYICDIYAWELM